jgi:hypothetical protein
MRCSTCGEDLLSPYRPLPPKLEEREAPLGRWHEFEKNVKSLTFRQHLGVIALLWAQAVIVLVVLLLVHAFILFPIFAYFNHSIFALPPMEVFPKALRLIAVMPVVIAVLSWIGNMFGFRQQKNAKP